MQDVIADTIALILWLMVFASPVIAIAFMWRLKDLHKIWRVLIGLAFGLFVSGFCFLICIQLVARNGLGS